MKKILFLSPLPPPNYGSATSSKTCLEFLKKEKNIQIENIKINYSTDIRDVGRINLSKIKGIFTVKKQIKNILSKFKPDLVYFVPATYSLGLIRDWLFVREIKKYWKGKILFHIRSRILDKTWKNPFGRRILRNMYKGNNAIVLGKELIKDLRGIIPKKDILILPNAIKNEVGEKKLKQIIEKRRKNKQLNILFLSNMDKTKGWKRLLGACKILNKKKFNFRCDFVGGWLNDNDKRYFENFVKNNGLIKKVFSQGKKFGKDKNEFLKKADIFVFPTEMETFGKVILEAYMFGLPVIANTEGAIPSIIEDKKTGFLLKENSSEEISEIILNNKDWKKKGLNGRKKFLRDFNLSDYRKNFIKIFK